jgi:hypothetical protein
MAKKPPLELVGSSTANPLAPPATLGKAGRSQWESIQSEYGINDSGGLALLQQVCAAVDEIAECTAVIARDGAMVRGKFGPREHPLLRHQLALRAFVCRTVQRLGLNLEPVKSVGRPGGWTA